MGSSALKDTPLYSSRILDAYLKLVSERYPHLDLDAVLEYAGMSRYEVADQAHWFRQEQVERFYERLVQMTGDANLARDAGRYAASPNALGAMRQYVLGLIGPANTFEMIGRITANFTRSSTYRCRKLSGHKVEIVVEPREVGLEKKFQCENRIGFFEAVVLAFSQSPPVIEHPECLFSGGKVCRYLVTWERSRGEVLRHIARGALLFLVAGNGFLLILDGSTATRWIVPASLSLGLLFALAAEITRRRELTVTLHNTRESNEKLIDQININYNNALMANEIGRALGSYTSVRQMLADVAEVMRRRLDYDRGLVLLENGAERRLELYTSYGYAEEELDCLNAAPFALDEPHSEDVYVSSFREQRPFLIDELSSLEQTLSPRSFVCSGGSGSRSFICCPIVSEGASLGVLAVEHLRRKRPLVQSDISLITGTASMIAISLRNCQLIADLKRAKEELELRVAERTRDLELKNRELERTYRELEEETGKRVQALEKLRENERMLIQQSRLAALGETISNIAHQWRQPLNELGLIVQELPMMYDQGRFSREYLKESVTKFMRVLSHLSKTIDDFRNFFKPDREKVTFGIGEMVERTLSLVVESFKRLHIAVEVQGEGEPRVVGHPNEFSQALLNILFNARDAFLERKVEPPRVIRMRYGTEQGRNVLTIADNAGGIAPEIMERIFDPYFTTRGPDKGTGIGLYMAKTIVEKNLNGTLSVRNVERGAEFRIEL